MSVKPVSNLSWNVVCVLFFISPVSLLKHQCTFNI